MPVNYHKHFTVNDDIIYLNHAAVSPWPVNTKNAVEAFAQDNCRFGSSHYPDWIKKETALREKLATLVNAKDCNDIALVKNTSEGLSMVAFGYPWQAGDNVVIPENEFPSNRIVWEALKSKGVEVRQITIFPSDNPEKRLAQSMDKNTRILSVSSVHYSNGLRLNLAQLGEACKKNNTLFCIDAIQSIGALQTDIEESQADFVIADGHKWMLGPEGLALFYSHPEARDKLQLNEYGWHMTEDPHNFTQPNWQVAKSARRFECGSPNMLCSHALYESIQLILEYGLDHIEHKVLENSGLIHDYLASAKNLSCVSSHDQGRFAGIVSFRHASIPSYTLYSYLMENKVMCADRDQAVRFSPHFYTDQKQIEFALNLAENANTHI